MGREAIKGVGRRELEGVGRRDVDGVGTREGAAGGGSAVGRALLWLLKLRPPVLTLVTCGVFLRLDLRRGEEKVGARLLLHSSRSSLDILPNDMDISVRGALWRAIHRVAEGGRREGRETRRDLVEARE